MTQSPKASAIRTASNDIVIVENLIKNFGSGETEARVLKGIDLSPHRGEVAALLGPSGSEKSTLLHHFRDTITADERTT